MTYEQAEELLEENKNEYNKDGRCYTKGLLLIEKYKPIDEVSKGDYEIYVQEFIEDMTKEDILQLNRYGFHLDEDSWAYFT